MGMVDQLVASRDEVFAHCSYLQLSDHSQRHSSAALHLRFVLLLLQPSHLLYIVCCSDDVVLSCVLAAHACS